MMNFLSFSVGIPYCIALQCSPLGSEKKKAEARKRMFEEASLTGSVGLFIEKMQQERRTEEDRSLLAKKDGWFREKGSLRGEIPPDLWRGNLRLLQFDENGVPYPLNEELPDEGLEIAYALEGPDDCMLYLSWLPAGDLDALAVSHRGVDAVAQESGPHFKGKRVLFLSLPRIAFCPFREENILSSVPVNDITNLWGVFSSREWFFRTQEVAFKISEKRLKSGDDGFSLAIDFGTSASTVALVKHNPRTDDDKSGVHIFEGLASWRHNTVVPDYSRNKTEFEIDWDSVRWESKSRLLKKFPVVPEIVRRSRWPVDGTPGGVVPALLYTLPNTSSLDGQCIIGDEAAVALSGGGTITPDHQSVHFESFVFSPKCLVSPKSADTTEGEKHVEAYLRTLFDMVAARLAFPSCSGEKTVSGYLKKVSCSFPVSWLSRQRDFLHDRLLKALESSSLRWFLPRGGAREVLAGAISLDEASAAFMGFLSRRFGKIDPREIMDLLGPFDYRNRSPESRNILVMDFGEGTTDVVWLKLAPVESSEAKVVSKIKRHFALNQGGLEVTRQIAEVLKDIAFEYNVKRGMDRSDAKYWLRTNLNESEIEESFMKGKSKTVARFRREKTALYFDKCEEIKKLLSSKDQVEIDWHSLLDETPLEAPDECFFSASRLVSIVERIFKPIFARVSSWAEEEGRLDVVLVSGRASALKGLREELEKSIPADRAPLKNDFIWPADYGFGRGGESGELDAKTVVATGLAHNVQRQIGFSRNFIECEPLDEMKRSRSIGILESDEANRWLPMFRSDLDLLVTSDFGRIEHGEELSVPIEEPNYLSEGAGLYLGMNFAGKKGADGAVVDRPQAFARIAIDNKSRKEYRKLRIFLKQLSATEVCLSRAEMEMPDGSVETTNETYYEEKPIFRLNISDVDIVMKPFFDNDDMRNSGKIHLDAREPIDRD